MQETQAQAAENESNSITAETYIRADSDRQFGEVVTMAGGVNRFFHFRRPTPLDLQNVVRMNRDTKYLGIGLRLQVFNPADPEEIALVNQLQDQFQLQAGSADGAHQPLWAGGHAPPTSTTTAPSRCASVHARPAVWRRTGWTPAKAGMS